MNHEWNDASTPNVDEFMERIVRFRDEIVIMTEKIQEERDEINIVQVEISLEEKEDKKNEKDYQQTLVQKEEKVKKGSKKDDKITETKEVIKHLETFKSELMARLKVIQKLIDKNFNSDNVDRPEILIENIEE